MIGTILFRMILWELTKVFLMALVGITGILLMAGIIAEATQQGLGPAQILAAIPLLIPSTLPYTIPATTLFAACVVYGRLAADNEILAIKSSGVNIFTVVKPGLVLGLAMSGCTMGLYYHLIPYTHYLLRSLVFSDAEELLYSMLRKHGTINYPQMSYSMFVRGVQGRKLISPTFKRRAPNGAIDIVAQAKEADLRVSLVKGQEQILLHMRYGVATSADGSHAYFEDRVWEMPFPENWGVDKNKRPRAMSWMELRARRAQNRLEIAAAEQLAQQFDKNDLSHPPAYHLRTVQQQGRDLQVEMQMRPALSMGCFFFILVACPVGIWFGRSDFLSSFITCFLPIVIVYYPLLLCGTSMAKEGRFAAMPLVWGANAVVAAIGSIVFVKLLRN